MSRHPQAEYQLPAGATQLLLVRHGSSLAGAAGVVHPLVDGHSDPPLAERGHAQAAALAARLRHERLDALFVSPLRRTAQTAAPLAAALGVEPVVRDDLREIHLGAIESEFAALAAAGDERVRRIAREQRWDVAEGAEPMERFGARVAAELTALAELVGPDRSAVAFTHAAVVCEACRIATGSEPLAFRAVENASVTRIVRSARGRWTLRAYNDVAHLEQRSAQNRPTSQ